MRDDGRVAKSDGVAEQQAAMKAASRQNVSSCV